MKRRFGDVSSGNRETRQWVDVLRLMPSLSFHRAFAPMNIAFSVLKLGQRDQQHASSWLSCGGFYLACGGDTSGRDICGRHRRVACRRANAVRLIQYVSSADNAGQP